MNRLLQPLFPNSPFHPTVFKSSSGRAQPIRITIARMPTREELHTLIDSMPDGAIEAAHRMLSNLQVWPPAPPPGVEEMRRDMHKRMEERRQEMMQRQRPGTVAGFGGHSNYDP